MKGFRSDGEDSGQGRISRGVEVSGDILFAEALHVNGKVIGKVIHRTPSRLPLPESEIIPPGIIHSSGWTGSIASAVMSLIFVVSFNEGELDDRSCSNCFKRSFSLQ